MAGSSNGDNKDSSAMFLDLKALDCPVCTDALTAPIFQCNNGHIVCSPCCNKLKNMCPCCNLPTGHIRCRVLERIIEGVIVPCPNVKCTESFSYGKNLSTHEKECVFCPCSCPAKNCDYTGSYKDLSNHFSVKHIGDKSAKLQTHRYRYQFLLGEFDDICFEFTEYTSVVMEEYKHDLLFVVQCFNEPDGVCVTVSCLAPCAKEVGEFSCCISTLGEHEMMIALPKVKKIQKVSSETPKEDFVLLPSYVLCGSQSLSLRVCVRKT